LESVDERVGSSKGCGSDGSERRIYRKGIRKKNIEDLNSSKNVFNIDEWVPRRDGHLLLEIKKKKNKKTQL